MTRREVARRLLGLLRPLAPLMTVSASARIVNQGLGVAIPGIATALVMGTVTGSTIRRLITVLVIMAVIKGVFRYVEQFTGHAVAFRLLAELRIDTFRKIVPLAPAGLEEERTGDLVSRVVGDIDRVEPFYAHTIAPLAGAIGVPLLTAAGLALWVDPVIGAVFIPFPVLIIAFSWLRARRVASLSGATRERAGETSAIFTDAVQGARELAVFDAGDVVADRVRDQADGAAALRRGLARIGAVRSGVADLAAGAAVVVVAAVAAARFGGGVIDVAGLTASIVVAWVGTGPARALEEIVPDLEQALAAAGRLFALADRKPAVEFAGGTDVATDEGSIRFREVTVDFGGSEVAALADVDVEVPDGSYVAVVGPSGSGKSTLVELLARFRDPRSGAVEIGGRDLRDIASSRLRETVMLVPQRPEIFFGTIASNLRLAAPGADEAELWTALERAALGEWARSLPQGLETTIGELGETMSGGQRQRLALARAFLRDPQVLVLDEATSELDQETERRALDEVAAERGKRTLVVVAHRIETVIDADEILVLEAGRLVERGRHHELAESGGVYSGLWRRHLDVLEVG